MTEVTMPQMGESIAEGTIVRWIKKVGDTVDRDEPLFEISTDKVDAEIPSPAAGVLTEIKVNEGETVAVNSVVAMIGEAGAAAAAPPAPAPRAVAPREAAPPEAGPREAAPRTVELPAPPPPAPSRSHGSTVVAISDGASKRVRSSPLVRRIAREHNVDVSNISGSGLGGRVTKNDILGHVRNQDAGIRMQPGPGVSLTPSPEPLPDSRILIPSPAPAPRSPIAPGDRVEALSVMRKKIAEHMVLSRRTSAHVHSVFHVNFSTIERIRQQKKAEYEQRGTKLTYMAFITQAVIAALRKFPVVNASLDGDNIVYKSDINVGIAVALESGLIVPVIKHADEKNLLGLSRSIADLAERARSKQLKPDEVQGGTFTITNPGQFGSQFGLPIINQPQVAILGVGTIEKRPVIVDDAIAIRTMAYLTLGYDHRLIDGATGDQFMAEIKQQIEHFDANQV
ncbi:MAG TPA: dihydrolipoamide acetyltransferase family protein [Vicinamibacterales bacterium]|jgi:2-oxoglutarate dehydrogenase E2 component (dihydrolipoamide succinyltransferase)